MNRQRAVALMALCLALGGAFLAGRASRRPAPPAFVQHEEAKRETHQEAKTSTSTVTSVAAVTASTRTITRWKTRIVTVAPDGTRREEDTTTEAGGQTDTAATTATKAATAERSASKSESASSSKTVIAAAPAPKWSARALVGLHELTVKPGIGDATFGGLVERDVGPVKVGLWGTYGHGPGAAVGLSVGFSW